MLPFSKKSFTCSTAITAQFSSDSAVDAPRCGIGTTPFTPSSLASGKSVTYEDTFPLSNAFIISSSSTSPPRAKLMILMPSFIMLNFSLLNMPFVLSRSGT